MLFLGWIWCHQAKYKLWHKLGEFWLPEILNTCGLLLDAWLEKLSAQKPSAAPMHQHKGIRPKGLDAVNGMLLLDRMEKRRLHRAAIASTHTDLVPSNLGMMQEEAFYNSQLYTEHVTAVFSECKQIQVSHLALASLKHVLLCLFLFVGIGLFIG